VALNLGGIIRLTYTVKNDLGAATNPSAATLTITQPDGTLATPTVTVPPVVTGQLVVDFTPAQAGLHSVHWATTGPTTAEDDMFVAEAPGRLLVSVDEAIGQLRAAGVITSDTDREQLQWLCLAASAAVELELDRYVVRRQVTYTSDASAALILKGPVISVTSVSIDGGAFLDPTSYRVQGGILTSRYGWTYTWPGLMTVNYVAGEGNPSPVTRLVALNLIQSLWQTSQQSFHSALDELSAEAFAQAALPGLSQIPGFDRLRAAAGTA
jgi:hypothetical protein